MRALETKFFGNVSIATNDDTYVVVDITIAGHTGPCSLFLAEGLGAERLEAVRVLLADLEALDRQARTTLRDELSADAQGTVGEFLTFHLEELPDAMANLLDGKPATAAALLEHVHLCGVAAHVNPGSFDLVLDYSPGRELTDQLLAVAFDAEGTLVHVSHES